MSARLLYAVVFGFLAKTTFPAYEISFAPDFLATYTVKPHFIYQSPDDGAKPKNSVSLGRLFVYSFATLLDYTANGIALYACINRGMLLSEQLAAVKADYFWQMPGTWWRKFAHCNYFLIDMVKIGLAVYALKIVAQSAAHWSRPRYLQRKAPINFVAKNLLDKNTHTKE